MEVIIVFLLWIPSMVWMYKSGFVSGSKNTMDWLEEQGYIAFDDDGNIIDPE